MLDNDLCVQSIQWATSITEEWLRAIRSPENPLTGESLELYKEYKEWRWFDISPLFVSGASSNQVTIMALAMRKYAKLLWAKEHQPKTKPSKWEVVTGKSKNRRK